jgi:hypothetical protein
MTYVRAKGRVIYQTAPPPPGPFEIADLGADIANYWNVDYGFTTVNVGFENEAIVSWEAELGLKSVMTQADSSKRVRLYKEAAFCRNHKSIIPGWYSGTNWMKADLGEANKIPMPWTRYFVFWGPHAGDQFIFASMQSDTQEILISQTYFQTSSGYSGVNKSFSPALVQKIYVCCWTATSQYAHDFYLDDPVTPIVSGANGGDYAIRYVSMFNERGGTAHWGHMMDILDCRSSHDLETRTNVMTKLTERFIPDPVE